MENTLSPNLVQEAEHLLRNSRIINSLLRSLCQRIERLSPTESSISDAEIRGDATALSLAWEQCYGEIGELGDTLRYLASLAREGEIPELLFAFRPTVAEHTD